MIIFTALKIHVSSDTKEVLDEFNMFELETRGKIEVKVKAAEANLLFSILVVPRKAAHHVICIDWRNLVRARDVIGRNFAEVAGNVPIDISSSGH